MRGHLYFREARLARTLIAETEYATVNIKSPGKRYNEKNKLERTQPWGDFRATPFPIFNAETEYAKVKIKSKGKLHNGGKRSKTAVTGEQ